MKLFGHWNDRRWAFDVDRDGERLVVRSEEEGERLELRFDDSDEAIRSLLVDSRKLDFGWTRKGDVYQIVLDGIPYRITVKDSRTERLDAVREAARTATGAEVRAPIPGRIRRVFVSPGERVRAGQALLTLDAMKMENEICSPIDGTVAELSVSEGETVEKDQPLVSLS